MTRLRTMLRRPRGDEAGFTLVEVIVAIVLLAMVSVAMLGLFIRTVKDSAGLDRRQAAVGVANQAMEIAKSIPPQKSLDKLILGRTQSQVDAQWTAAVGADLSQTDKLYDTTGSSSAPVLPVEETRTVGGITYTIRNLIGSCWRPATGGECVKAANKATGSVEMYRIIVHVSWTENSQVAGAATCSGAACTYSLASLVDVATDPSFNIYATNASWPAAPVLTTLTATTAYNTPVTVDLSTAVTSGATPLVATAGTPTQGATVSVLTNTTTITVTPATNFYSGATISVPFTVTDPYGQSTSSTLSVTVSPPPALAAASFTLNVPRGGSATTDLALRVTNATGTISYSVPATTPRATLSMSGSVLTYTRKNNGNSNETFTYTVTTSSGQTATGTVTINVV